MNKIILKNNKVANTMKKLSKYVLLVFLCIFTINAQDKIEPEIKVTARNYGDSVVVRWAPNTPTLWLLCNKYGYKIERVFYDVIGTEDDEKTVERTVPVRDAIFKPLTKEQMIERYKDEKHPQGMVATEFLYGEIDLRGDEVGPIADLKAKEDEQNMRFAYTLLAADLDPDVADAIGLRYSFKIRDMKDIQDSVITLRITPLVDTSIMAVSPVTYHIDISFINKLYLKPSRLYTESGDGHIKLNWLRDNYFTAYYIERSTDSINFTPLNTKPYFYSDEKEEASDNADYDYDMDSNSVKTDLPETDLADSTQIIHYPKATRPRFTESYISYIVTVPNGKKYYYRVYATDAFNDRSDYSEIVSGVAEKEIVLDPPSDFKAIKIGPNKVKLTWKEPEHKDKLQGYFISHQHTFAQEHIDFLTEELLPPGTKEFIHDNVKEGLYNIYFIYAVDFSGKYFPSKVATLYLNDTIAPLPPKNVSAVVDSSGLCAITWDHNEEDDIEGYKVYYSMNLDHMFNQLTDVPTEMNMYLDRVDPSLLNKEIYYKVVAVDRAGNHSDYSEVAVGKIPDFHAPVKPLVESYFVGNDEVKFTFIVDNSSDIKKHYFLKRKENAKWDTVRTITSAEVENFRINLVDTATSEAGIYEYCMQSEDVSGLFSSPSQVVTVKLNERNNTELFIKLEAKYNSKDKKVNLKWKKPNFSKDFHYVIYKSTNNDGWNMYESVDKETLEYNDSQINESTNYKYKIVPYRMGAKIGNGEEVTISIP